VARGPGQEVIEYYAQDALGSVRVVFNAAGQVTARADYEPFGEAFTWPGAPGGALPAERFTGQERDPEASQDYFGARYYQPRHGRFSQGDPVYAGLFDPQQWNRYACARNNPLSFVDPDGRTITGPWCVMLRAKWEVCVGGGMRLRSEAPLPPRARRATTPPRRAGKCRRRWSVAGRVKAATAASAASEALRRPVRSRRIEHRSDALSHPETAYVTEAIRGSGPPALPEHVHAPHEHWHVEPRCERPCTARTACRAAQTGVVHTSVPPRRAATATAPLADAGRNGGAATTLSLAGCSTCRCTT
jgi:RHS repeat-associated protein